MPPSRKKSWLTSRRISEPWCMSKMTPCPGKSSLKCNQWTWWGCSLGSFLPLAILVQLLHAPWVKCWPLPCNWEWKPLLTTPHQDLRALMPLCLWLLLCQHAAQYFRLALHLLQLSPCLTSRPPVLQLGSHPSCSLSVPNPGSMIIPPTVYLMTNVTRGLTSESRKSPLITLAMDPMSMPDQLPESLVMIPLPLKVAESESPSSISEMLRVTDVTPLSNTAMLAVGAVFHMSSPSLAMEFSPETALTSLSLSSSIPLHSSQGKYWLWWCCGYGGLWEYGRLR